MSAGDNKKTLESCVKTTSLPVAEIAGKGITLKNEEIQLEKLREELTCVVSNPTPNRKYSHLELTALFCNQT